MSSLEVTTLISSVTQRLSKENPQEISELKYKFVGVVKQDFFCISKKVSHPQSFLPRVTGRMRKTKEGASVRLVFQLFPLTRVFLLCFIGLCLFIGLWDYFNTHRMSILTTCLVVLFSGFLVAKANFLLHCRDFKALLKEELYL